VTLNVSKDDQVRGSSSAPDTVLVYGDYECPYTRALELVIAQLRDDDGKSFRYVFRYFPLRQIHPHAEMAAVSPPNPSARRSRHTSLPTAYSETFAAGERMVWATPRPFSSMVSATSVSVMSIPSARW